MTENHILAIFLSQLILLMFVGRLLGEGMARIGQPAIFGQLLAGVALGPSLFGALLPGLREIVFPDSDELKTMIDAVSQVGILLLLLLTGMETNLRLVQRRFRVVAMTSITGIAVPFICGMALGLYLPQNLVPDPARQFVTALFIGTALSISSVKIVAMVLMEVGFIRRDLGQLILATAILDDTIAWILVAVVAGMAAQGSVDLSQIGISIAATLVFLTVSLTIGRRLVAHLIRWTNDSLTIEFPVITAVLVVTFAMALVTDLIGVHSALGAFIAGVIIGQSPMLRGHIEQELRGLILAFFSPVFFAVAGLGMDLTKLAEPNMTILSVAFIAVATIGKSAGALLGGRLAGLSARESLALATGLNARGSTEVIIATIGVSMGVLNAELYTLIVAMAVITTMIMPPTLRWALARVPMRAEERKRLEKEEATQNDQLPQLERVLVVSDCGANAARTLQLAGAFAAGQQILTTVLEPQTSEGGEKQALVSGAVIARQAAGEVADRLSGSVDEGDENAQNVDKPRQIPVETLIQEKRTDEHGSGELEVTKGYDFVFIGLDRLLQKDGKHFVSDVTKLLSATQAPVMMRLTGQAGTSNTSLPRNILVPTSGTQNARLATEVAVALARASGGRVTALHVIDPSEEAEIIRGFGSDARSSVLNQAAAHARLRGVDVAPVEISNPHPNRVIRRMTSSSAFDLVVLGGELRRDGEKFLGPKTRALIRSVRIPILIVAS